MSGGSSPPGMRYAGLGIELAVTVGLLCLVGWWLDGRFGSAPWGLLIGALVGLAGGLYNLIRQALAAGREP